MPNQPSDIKPKLESPPKPPPLKKPKIKSEPADRPPCDSNNKSKNPLTTASSSADRSAGEQARDDRSVAVSLSGGGAEEDNSFDEEESTDGGGGGADHKPNVSRMRNYVVGCRGLVTERGGEVLPLR